MHQLYDVINNVEKTHKGLGVAVAMSIVCIKAQQCLLLVAPSGCGKSTITDSVASVHPRTLKLLSVTKARLGSFKDDLTNFRGAVFMDDMAGAGSQYERKETLVAFSMLCYNHAISKHTFTSDFEINDFFGAAVLNIQPVILAEICQYPEWESLLQERTLRYYHLYRPTHPVNGLPNFNVNWGIDLDLVHKPRHDFKLYAKLSDVGSIQWSDSRLLEHLDILLKAVAALDGRQDVVNADLVLLHKLMRPMVIERYIMSKSGFEIGRYMDTNLAAVLVEFASWKNISIERICRDYKISPSTAYRLLSSISDWFEHDQPMSKRLVPKPILKRILKEAGVER